MSTDSITGFDYRNANRLPSQEQGRHVLFMDASGIVTRKPVPHKMMLSDNTFDPAAPADGSPPPAEYHF